MISPILIPVLGAMPVAQSAGSEQARQPLGTRSAAGLLVSLDILDERRAYSFWMSRQESQPEVMQGTLDLMVLRTLETMGPQHGLGVAKRIEQIAAGALSLNQGTLYPALLRLEQRGWVRSKWGISENNRRARFYHLTAAGRRRIAEEQASWTKVVSVMRRFLRTGEVS